MEKIKVKEILEVTKGHLIQGDGNISFSSISTDTRTLKKGSLFFPLKGKNFDGHKFIPEAIKRGARGIIINRASCIPPLLLWRAGVHRASNDERRTTNDELVIIEVHDTLRAFQDIANYYRRRFNIPLVAITGSNGKTTTKEMLWNILSREALVLKNKDNYNNEIGVPLTLFELSRRYKFAVLEFGTNAPGEIKRLTEIAEPTAGIVTNIGLTHTEGLSDIDGVRREKMSLFAGIRDRGTAILNVDDKNICKSPSFIRKKNLKGITYGIKNKCAVYATEIDDLREEGMRFVINLNGGKSTSQSLDIHILLAGIHNVYNALAAAASAYSFGISPAMIKNGLENVRALPMRMEINKLRGITIINDAYNANPRSVEGAISMIEKWRPEGTSSSGRRILILGDMLELGRWSASAHRKLADIAAKKGIDVLFSIGKLAAITARQFKKRDKVAFIYNNRDNLVKDIVSRIRKGDIILIKGSRAMKMEEVTQSILSKLSKLSKQ